MSSKLPGNDERPENPDIYHRLNGILTTLESSLCSLTSLNEIPVKLPDAVSILKRASKPAILHRLSDDARQAFWNCLRWLYTSSVAEDSTAVQRWTVRILHKCLTDSTAPVEERVTNSPVLLSELAKHVQRQADLGTWSTTMPPALLLLAAGRVLSQNSVTSLSLGTELVLAVVSLASCGAAGEMESSQLISACANWISSVPPGHSSVLHLLEECPVLLERLILLKLLKYVKNSTSPPNNPLPLDVAECFADLATYGSTSAAVHYTTASVLIKLYHESSENELILGVIKTYLQNLHVDEMDTS